MKCKSCRHLRTEGYRHPESYCELHISDDKDNVLRAFYTGDGCNLTLEQRKNLCEFTEINAGVELWWREHKN